jgi:hypothetical protein
MTALAAAFDELGTAIADDLALVAKLPPRRRCDSCGWISCAGDCEAAAPDAQPGAADDDQRRADARFDKDYGGAW